MAILAQINKGHKVTMSQAIVIVFIFLFLTCDFKLVTFDFAYASETMRVAIIQDAPSLSLKIRGPYEIINPLNDAIVYQGNNLKVTVTAYEKGILIGNQNFGLNKILVRTKESEAALINGRSFRGALMLIKTGSNRLLVVNHIELEDYIKGILFNEVSHYWPMEALKAQAIASRTYAFYHLKENKLKDYDLTANISQIYSGKSAERFRTDEAVNQTKGAVLVYNNIVIPAYFFTVCGGATEDVSLVWKITAQQEQKVNIAPLKGVICNFCRQSPRFNWHCVLSLDKIKDNLVDAGYSLEKIKDITVLSRDNSGRITDLEVVSTKVKIKISANDFRKALGPDIIKSTNFNLNIVDGDAVFEGLGWGHGVGMCQWGAYFMAKEGYTAEQILKYYYPKVELTEELKNK